MGVALGLYRAFFFFLYNVSWKQNNSELDDRYKYARERAKDFEADAIYGQITQSFLVWSEILTAVSTGLKGGATQTDISQSLYCWMRDYCVWAIEAASTDSGVCVCIGSVL